MLTLLVKLVFLLLRTQTSDVRKSGGTCARRCAGACDELETVLKLQREEDNELGVPEGETGACKNLAPENIKIFRLNAPIL
jgi:hypothetical protein